MCVCVCVCVCVRVCVREREREREREMWGSRCLLHNVCYSLTSWLRLSLYSRLRASIGVILSKDTLSNSTRSKKRTHGKNSLVTNQFNFLIIS